jgi:hypothetical protein
MSDSKPSVWPWVVVVLVCLPLLYVALFGPACWLAGRSVLPGRQTSAIYRPLVRLACTDRGAAGKSLRWYARLNGRGEIGLFDLGVWAGLLQWEDGTSSTIRLNHGLPD